MDKKDFFKWQPLPANYYHLQIFEEDLTYTCRQHHSDIIRAPKKKKNKCKQESSCKSDKDKSVAKRGDITLFSGKSRLRLAHQLRNSKYKFKQFITLTYPRKFPMDGREVKKHLNTFLTLLRQEFENINYCWVLEAQPGRGAPHFHILIDENLPTIEKENTDGETIHHSAKWSNHWSRITGNLDNMYHLHFYGLDVRPLEQYAPQQFAAYMTKYMTKNFYKNKHPDKAAEFEDKSLQKIFGPEYKNVGRFWGTSRNFIKPLFEGLYAASELKEFLGECFKRANQERSNRKLKPWDYSLDKGCSIWGGGKIYAEQLEGKYITKLKQSRFQDKERPDKLREPKNQIWKVHKKRASSHSNHLYIDDSNSAEGIKCLQRYL
ncbi:hypothetical protein [Mariprofundus sp. KV]|uniref:rolling circle replication-associated protein n=1 Tax=Mariprofundus sp. KV TaxID=2608715 RepID=UPI0015A1B0BD|nr:hypothetical protein [Mariprofundus sp. KV]NWF35172.1 hypothetical protein [Mariprofundus sp. KV]